jgi:hypothetical protein
MSSPLHSFSGTSRGKRGPNGTAQYCGGIVHIFAYETCLRWKADILAAMDVQKKKDTALR